jgi:hypothetical protein
MEGIEMHGLSTIAPLVEDPEEVRGVFRELSETCSMLGDDYPGAFRCDELSMGMTSDFEVAVEEGSTLVRIGTGLFGPVRKSPASKEV